MGRMQNLAAENHFMHELCMKMLMGDRKFHADHELHYNVPIGDQNSDVCSIGWRKYTFSIWYTIPFSPYIWVYPNQHDTGKMAVEAVVVGTGRTELSKPN